MGILEKIKSKKYIWLILAVFFVLFLLVSWWSPVAGDDWAYAVNSTGQHPIVLAFERYFTWSGRFFSELWGYIITNAKWLWDWLNPCIFTGILYGIFKDAGAKKHPVSSLLLIAVLMLTVTDYLRMQTYSWMMGTTYVIPFLLFLIYVWLLEKWIFDNTCSKKQWAAMCILNFVIPLWMENIAAMMVGADILVLIYLWFKDRDKCRKMLVLTVITSIATAIIAFSPGAANRSKLDHAEFMALSLFEKIRINWTSFLRFTFTDNLWLTRILSLLFIVVVIAKRKEYPFAKWHCWILPLCFVWGILQTFGYNLYEWTGSWFFYNISDPSWSGFRRVNTIMYGIWVLAALYVIFTYLKGKKKWLASFVLFCAGGANLVMLASPIFDARSSFYTVYLFIFLCVLLFEELEISRKLNIVATVVLAAFFTIRAGRYLKLYYEVEQVTEQRQKYISWYLGDHSIQEGMMPAYPELSVHSANVEEGDTFHMYYFLRYYDLDPDLKLTFIEADPETTENQ